MWVKLALWACFVCGLSWAAKDNSVCTTISPPAGVPQTMLKPNISNQFSTRVEVEIMNKNQTTYVHEYFDAVNNRGYIFQKQYNTRYEAWYDYSTNEFIGFFRDLPASMPTRCSVSDLSTSDQRFLMGYRNVNGAPHIYSASGALHFGGTGVNEIYMGRKVVRGIQVDWWQSCQYWNNMDATMKVDWYFSAQMSWDTAVGTRVPIAAHIIGTSNQGGPHSFEHYYNFLEYRPYLTADDNSRFETPRGVQCPGRKLTQPFPSVPKDAFSFTTEILDTSGKHLSFMKETFYYSQKLVKYEYMPQQGTYAPYGYNDLIEIHDFHSGVAYVTDRLRGNCSYRKIESSDFDDRSAGPTTVRIRNSKEFFYFDVSKQSTSYEGVKKNRNIDCDTWVATRSDFPFGFPTNSTWEWYFATNKWAFLNAGPEGGSIPVQMRITMPSRGFSFQYNIYNFKKDKPDLLKFDISGCYQFGQRRKFQFMLNVTSDVKGTISTNVETFKYYVLQSIMAATGISPIRVANLQIYVVDVIIVTFELLDKSPIVGDTQRGSNYKEVSLSFAANTIAQMIQSGQFVVQLGGTQFMNINPIVAMPNSIVEITYLNTTTTTQNQVKTGYGAGPMAGVGITMPILGGGLGVLFAYFFFK